MSTPWVPKKRSLWPGWRHPDPGAPPESPGGAPRVRGDAPRVRGAPPGTPGSLALSLPFGFKRAAAASTFLQLTLNPLPLRMELRGGEPSGDTPVPQGYPWGTPGSWGYPWGYPGDAPGVPWGTPWTRVPWGTMGSNIQLVFKIIKYTAYLFGKKTSSMLYNLGPMGAPWPPPRARPPL